MLSKAQFNVVGIYPSTQLALNLLTGQVLTTFDTKVLQTEGKREGETESLAEWMSRRDRDMFKEEQQAKKEKSAKGDGKT
jgi:hypothetical protein